MHLIEPYAGMAAVSCRALGFDPPVKYQGGKRGYARAILQRLGITTPPDRITLNEADPYVADALRVIWTPELRAAAIPMILSWEAPEAEQRVRWEGWRQEAKADGWSNLGTLERGARWLWMRTRTVPMNRPPACAAGNWYAQKHSSNGNNQWRTDAPARNLGSIPATARATVICGRADDLTPGPGDVVYLDPPYPGTTGYSGIITPTWTEIAELAMRWADAGALVAVSSHEAMTLEAHVMDWRGAHGRNFGGTAEYLSIFRPTPSRNVTRQGRR